MVSVVIIRFGVAVSSYYDAVLSYIQRHGEVVVGSLIPSAALFCLAGQKLGPGAFRQVVLCNFILAEYRCNQKGITQHVLLIQIRNGRIVHELEYHWAHYRGSFLVCLYRFLEDVRHQRAFQVGEEFYNVACFVIEQPRHTVAS